MATSTADTPTRTTPSVRVSATLVAAAREVGPSQGRSMSAQIDYWARLGQSIEESPNFSRERVNAALRGEYNSAQLNDEESEAFYEGLAGAMDADDPVADAFYADLKNRGGAYGTDDDGRLIRSVKGGGTKLVEPKAR